MVEYYTPATLTQALTLQAQKKLVPYAGGTDLMVNADPQAEYLLLAHLPELRQICAEQDTVRIGACCTFSEALRSPAIPDLLKQAVRGIAAPAVRNLGTFGGNIANGSAKADSALIFFVADASLRLISLRGERIVPIRDFYLGRKQLDLAADELIAEIILPTAHLIGSYYKKIGGRESLAISRLAFAGLLDVDSTDVITHCAAAFGAVSDVILTQPQIDAMLIGLTREQAHTRRAAYVTAWDAAIIPLRGRVSAAYRKQVCLNLLNDFLDSFGL